ncbi:MAG: hypothetical protein IJZ57_11105 [Clostridia bacterium]|nr:hypothetical protein [Clostridia bacterium]
MPYIVINVMGRVSNTGNGSFYVDGCPYYRIKNGFVIRVSEGSHSIKYRATLKNTESTASTYFNSNTVMIANIVDEDFSAPDFRTHLAEERELKELEDKLSSQDLEQKFEEKREAKKGKGHTIRIIIGVIVVIASLYVTFTVKRNEILDCILPSVLMAAGAGLIKSEDFEEAAKGFFGWGIAWFAILAVLTFLGNIF